MIQTAIKHYIIDAMLNALFKSLDTVERIFLIELYMNGEIQSVYFTETYSYVPVSDEDLELYQMHGITYEEEDEVKCMDMFNSYFLINYSMDKGVYDFRYDFQPYLSVVTDKTMDIRITEIEPWSQDRMNSYITNRYGCEVKEVKTLNLA